MSNFNDVLAMHAKHGLPIGERPSLLDDDEMMFRLQFLMEELLETTDCHDKGDLAGVADGLVDLVVVAMGTAVWMGLPWQELWDEVQRANMEKERGRNESREGSQEGHDLVKPQGWVAPRIEEILRRFS